MRVILPMTLIAILLIGCVSKPVTYNVPLGQTYDLPPDAVWSAAIDAVRAAGLTITDLDEPTRQLVAVMNDDQPRTWVACKPARIIDRHDDKNRRRRAWPVGRSLKLTLDVTGLGKQSRVNLSARFDEEQINTFKNLPFQVRCPSTGILERRVLEAIG